MAPRPRGREARAGQTAGLSPEGRQRRIHLLQLLSALAAAAAGLVALAVLGGLHKDVLLLTVLPCFMVVAWQVVGLFRAFDDQ